MITNGKIEESLKNANLWFHTNTYFLGTIPNFTDTNVISGSQNKVSRYLINLTENDIIIIPIVYSGMVEDLFTEETIDICSGDIEKVVVVPQNGYYYKLEVRKTDGNVINITVNLLTDDLQRKNIVKFVENFKNEGSELLFREEFRPGNNLNIDINNLKLPKEINALKKVILFGVFAFIFTNIFFSALDIDMTPVILIFFVFGFIITGIYISKDKKRNEELRNGNLYNVEKRPSFSQMAQEQREEAREKRSEDILTSSNGPIVSNDENYGGIKKM